MKYICPQLHVFPPSNHKLQVRFWLIQWEGFSYFQMSLKICVSWRPFHSSFVNIEMFSVSKAIHHAARQRGGGVVLTRRRHLKRGRLLSNLHIFSSLYLQDICNNFPIPENQLSLCHNEIS